MQIVYLEGINDSWKAKILEKIKGTQSQATSKRFYYTCGTKRTSAVWGC